MKRELVLAVHDSVLTQVRKWVNKFDLNREGSTVLEIGSHDFNGSVRQYFDKTNYTGMDMQPGPGVDIVGASHDIWIMKEFYDPPEEPCYDEYCGEQGWCDCGDLKKYNTIICTEMLEHDPKFWSTMQNIGQLTEKGSYVILTARGATIGFPGKNGESMWEHGYPEDYWRFMPQSVPLLFDLAKCDVVESFQDTQHPGFIAIGRRR